MEQLERLKLIAELYKNTSDEKLKECAEHYSKLIDHLQNGTINQIIEYAENIYNKIDWNSKDRKTDGDNIDYMNILVHILNYFTANKRDACIADFHKVEKEYQRILNIIKGFSTNI